MSQLASGQLLKLQRGEEQVDGEVIDLMFVKAPGWRVPLQRGGEGFATPVSTRVKRLDGGGPWSDRFILKGFKHLTPERRQRTAFLCALRLSDLPRPVTWFEGAPLRTFSHRLRHELLGPEGVEIDGHLAPFVDGETYGDLIGGTPWAPSIDMRVDLARQLCAAVALLESVGLVHGDLAHNNIMVVNHDGAEAELRIIDFDGFYHPDVPALPVNCGRVWGTDGYRARAFRFGDPMSAPSSDRVALAVLVVELVTRLHDDMPRDGQFVHQSAIEAGMAGLDDVVSERWREGVALLSEAIAVEDPREAPAPGVWRQALDAFLQSGASAPVSLRMGAASTVLWRVRPHNQESRLVRLPASGSLESIGGELGWLFYEQCSKWLDHSWRPSRPHTAVDTARGDGAYQDGRCLSRSGSGSGAGEG